MPIPCAYAAQLMAGNSVAVAPQDQVTSVIYKGELVLARFQAFADGYQGYVPVTATYSGEGHIRSINPPKLRRGGPADTDLARLNGAGNDAGVLARNTAFLALRVGFQKRTPIDPSVLTQSLATCISELYPVFALSSFRPTATPDSSGSDRANGVVRIRDLTTGGEASIVNDPSPPGDVRADIIAHNARGRTDSNNPWWTYAISAAYAPELRPGEVRYPELYLDPDMRFVRTQIHETGAALTFIRNKYHPGLPPIRNTLDPGHGDDGPALEDCIGRRYYARMGLRAKP